MGVRQIGFGDAAPIGARLLQMFEGGEFDVATMIYSRFRSVIAQIPTAQQLIPDSLRLHALPSAEGRPRAGADTEVWVFERNAP